MYSYEYIAALVSLNIQAENSEAKWVSNRTSFSTKATFVLFPPL
jgi:hypothetical protein